MKGDFSRRTFDRSKHYSAVLVEQGRMLTDADLEEEHRILADRIEQETLDVLGSGGAPIDNAGFGISTPDGQTIQIASGVYYVEGLLVRNDAESGVDFQGQPHRYDVPPFPAPDGRYAFALDAWRRLVTSIDDPAIREVALGGPTTSVREQVAWQVKMVPVEATWTCAQPLSADNAAQGKMAARAVPGESATTPCLVPPQAGYTGLENQFYRVEVFAGGDSYDLSSGQNVFAVTGFSGENQNELVLEDVGDLSIGDAVEVYRQGAETDPGDSSFAHVAAVDAATGVVTLTANLRTFQGGDIVRLRRVGAVFVASRDNGAVVTSVEGIDGAVLTVSDTGPDGVLGFSAGQFVELIDDRIEMEGSPRQLYQIADVNPARRTVVLRTPAAVLTNDAHGVDPARHPKLRRWDTAGGIVHSADGATWIHLELGNEVRFIPGQFVSGDYWHFPARVATVDAGSGTIAWPTDIVANASVPREILPAGVQHHWCVLAWTDVANGSFGDIHDCRNLFPPLTSLENLLYVGGDGQEANPAEATGGFCALLAPIEVRVVNGGRPVASKTVRFTIRQGNGRLQGAGGVQTLTTDATGLASCMWEIDPGTDHQVCEAQLLDTSGGDVPHALIRFHATLDRDAEGHSAGGCCVTVGEHGQFPTIDVAIGRLMEQQHADICLCLLPGEHKWMGGGVSGEAVEQGLNLSIKGCGRPTRVFLLERFELDRARSLRLADMDVVEQPHASITTVFVDDVEMVGCRISGTPESSLLSLNDSTKLHISGSEMVARSTESLNRVNSIFAPIEGIVLPLWDDFDDGALDANAVETARSLAGLNGAQANVVRDTLQQRVDLLAEQLSFAEQDAARRLVENLRPRANIDILRGCVVALVRAVMLANSGIALVVGWPKQNGVGEVAAVMPSIGIENNKIDGIVSFYGDPDVSTVVSMDTLRTLNTLLSDHELHLDGTAGMVLVHGNRIARITIGRQMLQILMALQNGMTDPISSIYESFHLSNNVIMGGISEIVSRHFTMTANEFQLYFPLSIPRDDVERLAYVAHVIADSTVYVGNHARTMVRGATASIFNASRVWVETANLELRIG